MRIALLPLTLLAVAAATGAPGCTQDAEEGSVRALQSAGPVSFLCLGANEGSVASMALPLSACTDVRVDSDNFDVPHLYALVTQPIRGEVAVIDLTADSDALLDQDITTPGTNFLPIGANPTDIVSTPGGMASFVTVADPGFEGIFALPSDMIRGGAPRLTSWPSCSLPAAPGRMVLAVDPADESGAIRPSCDGAYGSEEEGARCGPDDELHCHGDLALDATTAGTPGRYKLVVTLPSAGGIAVIDAQALLDQEAGAFEPCRVERFLPLSVELSAPPAEDPPPPRAACVEPEPMTFPEASGATALPGGIAITERLPALGVDGGQRLFVADRAAPVIHQIDLPTPCEPREIEPLLPSSAEEPTRVVTTNRIAVSPATFDLSRYLYAIDEVDGSIMAFDITPGGGSRAPISRPSPEWNPFQPPDRLRFGSPPRDIVIVRQSADAVSGETGSTLPVRCDPSPDASGPAAQYQTSASFESGARPGRLRGVFAFAVLVSGDIVTIDIDDLDDACRAPKNQHPLFGCDDTILGLTGASGEYSCNTVAPHETRSASFLAQRDGVAGSIPGVQALPLAFDTDGSLLEAGSDDAPRMRATVPSEPLPEAIALQLPVGAELRTIDPSTGLLAQGESADPAHTLLMNLEDPRAHILSQSWTIRFEGPLPGFVSKFAELARLDGDRFELRDPATPFCGQGVLGQTAVEAQLIEDEGLGASEAATEARRLADYVQIVSETPIPEDTYWQQQNACTFNACQQTYGTAVNPFEARDLRIIEAREDALVLEPRVGSGLPQPDLKCCFPGVVEYRVRGGDQWIVVGSQVGFLHHVVPDADGVCRPSCDPSVARLDGRVRETPPNTVVDDGDPRAFINPFFRFAINAPAVGASSRDMRIEMATQGSFRPLSLDIAPDTSDVQPVATRFLPVTGELVVSDGSLGGVKLIRLSTLSVSRQYR